MFDLVTWLTGIAAAVVVGLTKTAVPGIGILAVILMASVFPVRESVGALLPMLITGDLFAIYFYRHHAEFKRVLELLPAVVAGMCVGAFVLKILPAEHFKPVLGGLILGVLALEFGRHRFNAQAISSRQWFTFLCGFLAGFATTVGNVAGPIMNIYLIGRGLRKEKFLGTIAWYFFIINSAKVPIYVALDMINLSTLKFDAFMVPVIVIAAVSGRYLLKHISPDLFKILVLLLAALGALRLLI